MDNLFSKLFNHEPTWSSLCQQDHALTWGTINSVLQRHPDLQDLRCQVLHEDELFSTKKLTTSVIFSVVPGQELGHWTALFVDSSRDPSDPTCYYLNPGNTQGPSRKIHNYISLHSGWSEIYYNYADTFQHPHTITCGFWCLSFLLALHKGTSFDQIVDNYTGHIAFDQFVTTYTSRPTKFHQREYKDLLMIQNLNI